MSSNSVIIREVIYTSSSRHSKTTPTSLGRIKILCNYYPRTVLSYHYISTPRALCRIQLLPVTHVLVHPWMLTVKPVYKLLNVSDALKWTTNTHVTQFVLTFKAELTISVVLEDLFVLLLHFLPGHHPSTHISTRPYSFLPVQMTGGRVSI